MRICTVGRKGASCARVGKMAFPIWIGKIYEKTQRTRDGKSYWRLVGTYGPTYANSKPSPAYLDQMQQLAPHEFRQGITNRVKVEQ